MKLDKPLIPERAQPIALLVNLKRQLQFYLDKLDMSASQLARKAGVPKQSISGWLAGSNPRDIRQVKKVADALGTTVDHLMFGAGMGDDALKATALDAILGDDWISGAFEIKIRRIKKGGK